jgi:hypothetical protein
MRRLLLCLWLTLPIGAGAYHYGPGQDRMALDEASRLMAEADAHARQAEALAVDQGDALARDAWRDAELAYAGALDLLPRDRVHERRSLTLERSKCRMFLSELPEAAGDLQGLVDEMVEDEASDGPLLADARHTLANAQYYMTWLMRLEGRARDEWEPRIEASRQTFRLLAEQAEVTGDEAARARSLEDLESAVRLARMDLTELQGLPLPSQ